MRSINYYYIKSPVYSDLSLVWYLVLVYISLHISVCLPLPLQWQHKLLMIWQRVCVPSVTVLRKRAFSVVVLAVVLGFRCVGILTIQLLIIDHDHTWNEGIEFRYWGLQIKRKLGESQIHTCRFYVYISYWVEVVTCWTRVGVNTMIVENTYTHTLC